MENTTTNKSKVFDMVLIAMFAVLIAICSWTSIPSTIPFTLQTFGVFCAVGLLGGKRGTLSVLIYILLGAVGLPVFAGFKGGIGALLGPTGGYIAGFLFTALVMWIFTHFFGEKTVSLIIAMILGLFVCYAFGTIWFVIVYSKANGAIGIMQALSWCVIPYLIPDALKIALAFALVKLIPKKFLNR